MPPIRRSFLRALRPLVLVLTLAVALGLGATGTVLAVTGGARPTVVARPTARSVVVGHAVRARGWVASPTVLPPRERASLQVHLATGWTTIRRVRIDAQGHYDLPVPTDWYDRHRLRVLAPEGVSRVFGVDIRPSYRPVGLAASHRLYRSHARWDPCTPIGWSFNPGRGYAGSLADVHRAFAEMSRATGLTFVYRGRTSKVAFGGSGTTSRTEPDAQVVVSWATPRQVPDLRGSVAGLGGSSWVQHGDGAKVYFQGALALDSTERGLRHGFPTSGHQSWGQVMLHEIGHVIGLDHTRAANQVMNPALTSHNHRLGAGDLAGAHALGAAQGCLTSPSASARRAPGVVHPAVPHA